MSIPSKTAENCLNDESTTNCFLIHLQWKYGIRTKNDYFEGNDYVFLLGTITDTSSLIRQHTTGLSSRHFPFPFIHFKLRFWIKKRRGTVAANQWSESRLNLMENLLLHITLLVDQESHLFAFSPKNIEAKK